MDEIRCPMCGKLNPPELENCQYCQARLKPLIVSQSSKELESTPPSPDEEESLPDWLRSLRTQENQLPDQEQSGFDEELPAEETGEVDWLKQLRDQSLTDDEEHTFGETEVAPFTDETSGLERLGGGEPPDQSAPLQEDILDEAKDEDTWSFPAESVDDEVPDWLSMITSESASQDQIEGISEPPEAEIVSPLDEPLPDWLSGLSSAEEENVPTWMPEAEIELGSFTAFETQEDASSEESQEGVEEPPEEIQGEEVRPEDIQEEEPIWLRQLKGERAEGVPPIEEAGQEEEPALEKAELPDWLVNLQVDQAAEEPEVEELPEWLAKGEQEEPSEASKDELPDWLTSLEAQEAEEVSQPVEMPEFLGSLEAKEFEESFEMPPQVPTEEFGAEEPPEWMAELEKGFSSESVGESMPPFAFDEEELEEVVEPVGFSQEGVAEELEQQGPPEWLAELEKEFSPESVQESVPAIIIDEEEVEPPVQVPSPTGEEGVDFLESVPDWVAEVPTEEGIEGEEEEPPLEEAELPGWLEAMRPVESVPLDVVEEEETAERIETIGPLAGLSGILIAESNFARVRKPPAYSVKLRVTDMQEARVELLRELLTSEDKQKPLPVKPIITSQYIFRLVIALALIIPIVWAVISGATLTPMPDPANMPAGVMDMRSQIDERLSTNSPVLIAFDYEAGFSSELDLTSQAVIAHMMDKGAFLTLVSTSPSGPILAQRLMDSLNQTPTRQENPYTNFANMGYIPGGTAGLLSLAQSPRQTVPYSLDNVLIWESAPLSTIDNITDFSMVLVLTDSPEIARAWIEQVQPFLKTAEKPLVMVASAQAEPLVIPYYQGNPKQVQALVVGFPDGVAYSSMSGQGELAPGSWDAFSLSMLITGIILLAGMVVGLGSKLYISTKREES